MAARYYQPYRIKSQISCPNDELDVTATKSESGDTIVVKVVNVEERPHRTRIKIEGVASIVPQAKTVVLTGGDLNAINTATHPRRIVPVEGFQDVSTEFTCMFPGYSYTIIKLREARY